MTTTVVFKEAVGLGDQTFISFELEADGQVAGFHPDQPLQTDAFSAALDAYDAQTQGGTGFVRDIGEALWDSLTPHSNHQDAFQPTLQADNSDSQITLKFRGLTDDAKRLPWEALRCGDEFLSIESRVPIIRAVDTTKDRQSFSLFRGEKLRFLAIIAASGDDGLGEWLALKRALNSVADTLPMKVLILRSSDTDWSVHEFEPIKFPHEIKRVPSGTSELVSIIQEFSPHIAHFFCHGRASGHLEIKRWSSNLGGRDNNVMGQIHLRQALDLSAWVTVLNACHLGGVDDDADEDEVDGSDSLCEKLIESGFPVVIGMRKAVHADKANEFAQNFHRNLLREIGRHLGGGGGRVEVARCFADACNALSFGSNPVDPCRDAAWTFPVMYQRAGDLNFERAGAELNVARIDTIGPAEETDDPGPDLGGDADRFDPKRAEHLLAEIRTLSGALNDHADAFAGAEDVIRDRIASLTLELSTLGVLG